MLRKNFFIALFALIAAALVVGQALAHGGAKNALPRSVVERTSITPATLKTDLAPNSLGATLELTGIDHLFSQTAGPASALDDSRGECPDLDDGCCSHAYCAGAGLLNGVPTAIPSFKTGSVALPMGQAPSDAPHRAQIEPPCR